jgi:hypothetical protein
MFKICHFMFMSNKKAYSYQLTAYRGRKEGEKDRREEGLNRWSSNLLRDFFINPAERRCGLQPHVSFIGKYWLEVSIVGVQISNESFVSDQLKGNSDFNPHVALVV